MTTATADRLAVARGGVNTTLLRLELRRLLRNRRTLIFTLVMPVVFFLIFGLGQGYPDESAGRGNVTAYVMISMALYGAMIATTGGGATVSVERASGWSRQLRLTPLSPAAYIAVKLTVAMTLGAAALAVVYVAGAVAGAHMDGPVWATTAVVAWLGSSIFAAFGLFVGYLLPSENVVQVLGPGLALLAFGGGLFLPLQDGSVWAAIARFTPMYGIGNLVHAPLTGDAVQWTWIVSVVVWFALFAGGAAWRFRRDTARV